MHPHPEAVRDDVFRSHPFFDPRDRVEVKYERVRRHQVDGRPVTEVAARFGVSRQTFYQTAALFEAHGIPGLVPKRPGLFEVFLFFRDRSNRANSARVGVSTPDASANRRMNASWDSPVSRRSLLRIAAFASSVVASMPTVFPRTRPAADSRSRTHVKTASWVSTSIRRRVRDSVE